MNGSVYGVAINSSGIGIIGGHDNTGLEPAFAFLVAPNGILTELSGAGFPSIRGIINGVAINSSGAGIIGENYTTALPMPLFLLRMEPLPNSLEEDFS